MGSTLSQRVGEHVRSNVIGYLALFIALTIAPAMAATKVAPKNSVTSKSIKDGQVQSADIGDGQVNGADIGDGQVTGADIGDSQVTSTDIGDSQVSAADLAGGALNWNALGNVPAGFADGSDANSGGTVTEVATGSGLSGGPIDGSGVVRLNSCPNGQLLKSTGSDYACANDVDTNSGGDITGVSPGAGLTGGGIFGDVPVSLTTCALNEVLQSTGSGYTCKPHALGFNSVFGATPSVAGLTVVTVNSIGPPGTITDLTGGVPGQVVTLLSDGNTTINDAVGGNFALTSNWTAGFFDMLTLARIGGTPHWVEVARSDN